MVMSIFIYNILQHRQRPLSSTVIYTISPIFLTTKTNNTSLSMITLSEKQSNMSSMFHLKWVNRYIFSLEKRWKKEVVLCSIKLLFSGDIFFYVEYQNGRYWNINSLRFRFSEVLLYKFFDFANLFAHQNQTRKVVFTILYTC